MTDTEIMDPAEIEQHADAEAARIEDGSEPTTDETPAPAEKPKREKKAPAVPRNCLCQLFQVGEDIEVDGQPDRTIFTTECTQTTLRNFAQGHDARLVSFLVKGAVDGYTIWKEDGGMLHTFPGPVEAAASISEPLGVKAEKAYTNAKSRLTAVADRKAARDKVKADRIAAKEKAKEEKAKAKAVADAAKAAAKPNTTVPPVPPREVPVAVVPGSDTGAVSDPDTTGATEPTELEPGEKVVTIKVGRNEIQATMSADGRTVSWRNAAGEYKERAADTVRVLADA